MQTWLTPTLILTHNFRLGLDMERWPTPPHHSQFQIWPGHGKMTNPAPSPSLTIPDLAWTWEDDWPTTFTLTHNFRFGLDMGRWLTPTLILTHNFRFGLDMERWLTLHPHPQSQFQIWSEHRKMTDPPSFTRKTFFRQGNSLVPYFMVCCILVCHLTTHWNIKVILPQQILLTGAMCYEYGSYLSICKYLIHPLYSFLLISLSNEFLLTWIVHYNKMLFISVLFPLCL